MQLAIGWTLAFSTQLYLIFGLIKVDLHRTIAATYSSLSHSLWAIALAWIIIACATGNGGYINDFLSAPWFYSFSRLTYCAYLVHSIVTQSFATSNDAPIHLAFWPMVRHSIS